MRNLLKRIGTLILCLAIVMGDTSMTAFAVDVVENEEYQQVELNIEDTNNALSDTEEDLLEEVSKDVEEDEVEDSDSVCEEKIDNNTQMTANNDELGWNYSEDGLWLDPFEYEVNEDGKSITITGYGYSIEYGRDFAIPEELDGYKVTRIGERAFAYQGNDNKLIIPDTVTTIEKEAFMASCFVGDLIIPESVNEIGEYAFYGCDEFNGKLVLPSTIEIIEHYAFSNCGLKGELHLPDSLKTIECEAFSGCKGFIGELFIPESVERIGIRAFADCSGFSGTLTIPNTLKKIGHEGIEQFDSAFDGCNGIIKIVNDSDFAIKLPAREEGWIVEGETVKEVLESKKTANLYVDMKYSGDFEYIESVDDKQTQTAAYTYDFDFNDFNDDSTASEYTEKKHSLATMSMKVAMSAMSWGNGTHSGHIRNLTENLGFDNNKAIIHYPTPNINTIGYYIGSRKLIFDDGGDSDLILVAVRGGGYGNEWSGNAYVGNEKDHAGFSVAANQVNNALKEYISENGIDPQNTKVWVCGYSRAAAVSNLVTARLDDGAIPGLKCDNIYGFCFECPRNTTTSSIGVVGSKYMNIYNYINPNDLVPYLAMNTNGWNFKRYGRDIYFPSDLQELGFFEIKRDEIYFKYKNSLNDIFDYNNNVKGSKIYTNKADLMRVWGNPIDVGGMLDINYRISNELTGIFSTRSDYGNYEGAIMAILKDGLKGIWSQNIGYVILTVLNLLADKYVNVSGEIKWPDLAAKIITISPLLLEADEGVINHYPEVNLAWMEAFSDNEDPSFANELIKYSNKTKKRYYVNCPVDVRVYDEYGTLIGAIVNDEVQNFEANIAYIDSNGQKVIVLPSDLEHTMEIVATDNGELTITAETFGIGDDEPIHLESYTEIPIQTDDVFSVKSVDEEDLVYSGGELISPDIELNEGEISYQWVGVEYDSNCGYCSGNQYYKKGEFAQVSVKPLRQESDFDGWYIEGDSEDAEPLSTELTYRFLVKDDVNLEARFKDISGQMWIRNLDEEGYGYTGTAIKPSVQVYDGTLLLEQNKDYTIAYKNNTNYYELSEGDDGFAIAKAPTITVTGKGNYAGKETATFKINRANIADSAFAADDIVLKTTGRDQKPKPVFTWNGKNVVATGYSYQYFKADEAFNPVGEAVTAVKDAGNYVIVISGKNNFTGTRNVKLKLTSDLKLLSGVAITKIPNQPYTGGAITPTLTVKDGKTPLVEGVDYTVEYKNNVAVGNNTATATITGIGNYIGTKKVAFTITGTALSKATVMGITSSVPYTGNDITFNDINLFIKATRTTEQMDLEEGSDYTVSYQNNQKVGTATVIFTGINGYTGTVKKTFRITALKSNDILDRIAIELVGGNEVTYSKGGAKPSVKVTFTNGDETERVLAEKTDYTVSYSNNTAVNDGNNPKKLPTVKITLKGNITGSLQENYTIVAKDISTVKAEATDKVYQPRKNAYATTLNLYDVDGKKLVSNTDYNKELIYTYKETTEVINNGISVERLADSLVEKDDILPAGTAVIITANAKANSNYVGTISTEYRISKSSISSATIKIPDQIYTGKVIEPTADEMTVTVAKQPLTAGEDFEVVPGSYVNNVKTGNASVTIKGKGNYIGTKKVNFKIKQKAFVWWWNR